MQSCNLRIPYPHTPSTNLHAYLTSLCPHRKFYRGLGSMLLPHEFWVPHGSPPWRGGVERALMSTTADKAVALHYTNGKGTVVEIGHLPENA